MQKRGWLILLVPVIVISLHSAFLNVDPDIHSDIYSRGAFIDEALYTFQARQWVDNGNPDIYINDAFVRSPVFQLLQSTAFLIGGTSISVSRLVSLFMISLLLMLAISDRENRPFGIILSILFLFQWQIFHFSHYSLVYPSAIGFIGISMLFFAKAVSNSDKNIKYIILSAFALFLAYGTTIQMMASALILPAASFFISFSRSIKRKKMEFRFFIFSLIATIFFAAIYYFFWFKIHEAFFQTTLLSQSDDRFPKTIGHLLTIMKFNFRTFIWVKAIIPYLIPAVLSLILYWPIARRYSTSRQQAIFTFSLIWFLIEIPKTGMFYLPYRYMLSFIAATVILAAFFWSSALQSRIKYLRIFAISGISLTVIFSLFLLSHSLQQRFTDISKANEYLKGKLPEGSAILGSWAPAVTWECNVKCIPVWNGYLNDHQIIEKYKPRLIITEFNEAESDKYYEKNNINLKEISDSMRILPIWRYNIAFYWTKKEIYNP